MALIAAKLAGAAGLLKGRRATTHSASFHLLPFFGAIPVNERVVVDGELVCASDVTSGIDADRRRCLAATPSRPGRDSSRSSVCRPARRPRVPSSQADS